ncbi:hypothetical protein TNCV_4327311, partial [Trichonephila clavipes]
MADLVVLSGTAGPSSVLDPKQSGAHLSTQCSGMKRRKVDLAQPVKEPRPVVWKAYTHRSIG